VSNVSGDPIAADDNGFISRIRPDGSVETLRWIDGASPEVTLNAPKGMALRGDTLFVADIDTVRLFNRTTGAPIGDIGIPGATFLNSLASGPNGLYVTDSGFGAGFQPTGSDAIYLLSGGRLGQIASGAALARPNGITVGDGEIFTVGLDGALILRMPAGGGEPTTMFELPAGRLDGVVRFPSGEFLVSSWESNSVYYVRPGGSVEILDANIPSPAGLGWDSGRRRALIPSFTGNRIEIRYVPGEIR
jgi:hypothetical protein